MENATFSTLNARVLIAEATFKTSIPTLYKKSVEMLSHFDDFSYCYSFHTKILQTLFPTNTPFFVNARYASSIIFLLSFSDIRHINSYINNMTSTFGIYTYIILYWPISCFAQPRTKQTKKKTQNQKLYLTDQRPNT